MINMSLRSCPDSQEYQVGTLFRILDTFGAKQSKRETSPPLHYSSSCLVWDIKINDVINHQKEDRKRVYR